LEAGALDRDLIPVYIKGKEGANQEKNQIMPVQNKVFTTDAEDEERREGRGELIAAWKTASRQAASIGRLSLLDTFPQFFYA
jgi:hypothetical protein